MLSGAESAPLHAELVAHTVPGGLKLLPAAHLAVGVLRVPRQTFGLLLCLFPRHLCRHPPDPTSRCSLGRPRDAMGAGGSVEASPAELAAAKLEAAEAEAARAAQADALGKFADPPDAAAIRELAEQARREFGAVGEGHGTEAAAAISAASSIGAAQSVYVEICGLVSAVNEVATRAADAFGPAGREAVLAARSVEHAEEILEGLKSGGGGGLTAIETIPTLLDDDEALMDQLLGGDASGDGDGATTYPAAQDPVDAIPSLDGDIVTVLDSFEAPPSSLPSSSSGAAVESRGAVDIPSLDAGADGEEESGVIPFSVDDVPAQQNGDDTPTTPAEMAIPSLDTTQPVFAVDNRVECRHGGGRHFFPGRVVAANGDGTYAIDYDDGDKKSKVTFSLIRLLESQGGDSHLPSAGGVAEAVPGQTPAPAADVAAATGPADPINSPAFAVGTRVECRHGGGKHWFPGKVASVNGDGTFAIDYDDGDKESNVVPSLIRPEEEDDEEGSDWEEEESGGGGGSGTPARPPDPNIQPDSDFSRGPGKLAIGGTEFDGRFPELHCTSCGFGVLRFRGHRWCEASTTNGVYMHIRNYNGHSLNVPKLREGLSKDEEYAAYACQCSWQSARQRKELDQWGSPAEPEGGAANGKLTWGKKKK